MSLQTRRWKRRIGVSLMSAAMAATIAVAAGGAAVAQESEGAPEETQEATVTRSAFYDAPLLNIFPPSVLQSFPPGVICLVEPKPCTGDFHEDQPDGMRDGYQTGRGGVQDGMRTAQENDPNEPVSPVPPDTLPVSITTGQTRYQSAVAFELPAVPEGHQVDEFKLYLTPTDPTGGVSSPMFRQAVLAFMTCVRGCQEDQFEKIFTVGCTEDEEGPCPAEDEPLQVEMCPIADDPFTENRDAEWEEGASQDPESAPDTDCFLGANGRVLDDGETWEFDMTYALDAWAAGDLANKGVLISPQTAPNFAFGDPDSTFNKQVTFTQDIRYTVATSEAPEPVTFSDEDDFSGGGDLDASGGSSGGFSAPSGSSSSGSSGNISSFSAPANEEPPAAEPEPEVAAGDGGAPAAEEPATEPVAAGEQEQPGSAWYAWLLAPVFAAGMWLTAQSLTAAPAAAAGPREGAMTRLVQQQQASSSTVNGPQLA